MEIQTNYQSESQHKIYLDLQRLMMDKIDLLENLLTAAKPGPKGYGDETVYVPVLSDENAEIVEREIMKLIKKIC